MPSSSGPHTRRPRGVNRTTSSHQDMYGIANVAVNYLWTAYTVIGGNFIAVATVFVIVILSFILPDISQKMHVSNEMKAMQKVLNIMSEHNQRDLAVCTTDSIPVTQSAPVKTEKKIGLFRRIFFPNRNASRREIAIMSYVYTDSFDAQKPEKTATDVDIITVEA